MSIMLYKVQLSLREIHGILCRDEIGGGAFLRQLSEAKPYMTQDPLPLQSPNSVRTGSSETFFDNYSDAGSRAPQYKHVIEIIN